MRVVYFLHQTLTKTASAPASPMGQEKDLGQQFPNWKVTGQLSDLGGGGM